MGRIDKDNYYLDIAETVLERSTCLRRMYGAIIVRNDEIVSKESTRVATGRDLQSFVIPGLHDRQLQREIRDRQKTDVPVSVDLHGIHMRVDLLPGFLRQIRCGNGGYFRFLCFAPFHRKNQRIHHLARRFLGFKRFMAVVLPQTQN